MEREEAQQLVVEAIHNDFVDSMADLILDAYAQGQRNVLDELATLRARIAAAVEECERIERDYFRCDSGHGADVARAIRAKLERQ